MQLVAHGGAGVPPDEPADRRAVLEDAVGRGSEAGTPLAAVSRTLTVLETDPRFNAGVGGAVQSDGRVRTDAGVMRGDGTTGAAAAMAGVERAVDVARAVAVETPHVLLAGERAVAFADAGGIETDRDLLTDETRERFQAADPPTGGVEKHVAWVRERFGGEVNERGDHDTVGAVATDGESVAAATSTAGRWYALAGRVGDVPQVGAGFYASPAGGASATGAGEDIARTGLARRAVALLEEGVDPEQAAERAIEEFDDRSSGTAGVVVMTPGGDAGEAHSSPAMQTARDS